MSDQFELTDAADVHEVLRWIDANADGRAVEALVVVDGWTWAAVQRSV